jgi:ubiquitin-like 1-activating enzyme E1 B
VVNLALEKGVEREHAGSDAAKEDEGSDIEGGDDYDVQDEPPEAEVSVFEDKRILADPDFDDNWSRTLEDLGCGRGKFITIVDEEGEGGGGWGTIAVAVGLLP